MLTGTAYILPLRVDGADDRLPGIMSFQFCSAAIGVDVAQQIVLDQFVELLAGVELHRRRRIAADGAVDRGGAGIGAAGDGGVDPGAAGLRNWSANTFTAADSPPEVHQWITSACRLLGLHLARKGQQSGERDSGCLAMEHGNSSFPAFLATPCNR